jgi:rubrerythrin
LTEVAEPNGAGGCAFLLKTANRCTIRRYELTNIPTAPARDERPDGIPGVAHRRQFKNLSEQEVLALAISSEEDDARIYRWYAQRLCVDYPQSAQIFEEMAGEEDSHRAALIEEHRRRFGDAIPLIRREHVAGFYNRRPVWLIQNLGPDRIREEAARMELEASEFYHRAAQRTTDARTRELLDRLAAVESGHESTWRQLMREHLPPEARAAEDAKAHREMVLTWVQPGLAGLMDGSVSTLAPIFAAAFCDR